MALRQAATTLAVGATVLLLLGGVTGMAAADTTVDDTTTVDNQGPLTTNFQEDGENKSDPTPTPTPTPTPEPTPEPTPDPTPEPTPTPEDDEDDDGGDDTPEEGTPTPTEEDDDENTADLGGNNGGGSGFIGALNRMLGLLLGAMKVIGFIVFFAGITMFGTGTGGNRSVKGLTLTGGGALIVLTAYAAPMIAQVFDFIAP